MEAEVGTVVAEVACGGYGIVAAVTKVTGFRPERIDVPPRSEP